MFPTPGNAHELDSSSEKYLNVRQKEFRFIEVLLQDLESNGILDTRDCYIAGSFVMDLYGLTPDRSMFDSSYVSDIDLVVPIESDLDLIVQKLHDLSFAQSLNLSIIHNGTSIKVISQGDNSICIEILAGLKLNGNYHPFFDSMLNTENVFQIGNGLYCWNLLMCLVYKLEYWREKDRPDVQQIVKLYCNNKDFFDQLMHYLHSNGLKNAEQNLAELLNT